MACSKMFPSLPLDKQPGVPVACLYSGAKFTGDRKWKKMHHNMEVHFLHVDQENELVYGHIMQSGTPSDFFTKKTYFEGEIVGNKHGFLTRKWHADAEVDRHHWWRFDCMPVFENEINTNEGDTYLETFDYGCLQANDQIYMRWKEQKCKDNVGFVAPGFYYVCLRKTEAVIEGIYYERFCDAWNEDTFRVKHTQERGLPVFQFR